MALVVMAGWVGLATAAPGGATAPGQTDRLWSPGRRDPGAGLPGRWERAFDARKARLKRARGRDIAAIDGLLGLMEELGGEIEPARLATFVEGVGKDRRRHPLVRSHARYLRARLHERAGQRGKARAILEDEGYVTRWQIVGPFDNAERKGHGTVYGPEKEAFDPGQTFEGKVPGEPLTWRVQDYEALPHHGYLSFDDVLRPNTQVVGYATTWIRSPKTTDAALHLGSGGAYKVWLNGVEVGESEVYRGPDPLQEAWRVRLAKGWNRVLVKVAVTDGLWGVYLRVSDKKGAAIPGLQNSAELHPSPKAEPSPDGPASADSVRSLLEAAHAKSAKRGGVPLVNYYRWAHPFGDEDRTPVELAREVDEAVESSRSAWLLAILDPDTNTARRALEQTIERARKEGARGKVRLAPALLEMAWRERSLGLERRYRSLVREAFDLAPDDPVVELEMAEHLADSGMPLTAVEWVRDIAKRYPESSGVQGDLADRLLALGKTEEALALMDTIEKRHGSGRGLSSRRIDALMRLGRLEEAVAVAERMAAATPGLPSAHARLASLEVSRNDLDAARRAYARALALAPQDPDIHAVLGQILARSGDTGGAITALERSLALKPQQPWIQDLLETLDDRGRDDLWARYGVDLKKVGAAATPKSWKGKEAGILHSLVAVRVHPNGLSERLDHRIIRVLDDRGIRSQASQGLVYDPSESVVEVRRARVRRADGTVETLGDARRMSLARAGYRMYYDQREVQVFFPGLRVGDTIEVAFVVRDVAAENMFDEYFGDLVSLQGTAPRKRTQYILEAPADRELFFNKKVSKKVSDDGKTATYRYAVKDVAAIKGEGGMPGWTEVADYLHVSTYETWDEVGRWYWNLIREQLVVDDKIRQAVADTLKALPETATDRDKARALYAHVVRSTRYVGLEFGIHGYKPYRTTEVYERRFGDCKDKASLLKVMLGEAGIDSHLVLIRTRDQGRLEERPASLSSFNHAIVYVPSLNLYLDGTAEWSGPDELPNGDQAATLLIVKDGKGADFVRTSPVSAPGDNREENRQVVELQKTGDARLEATMRVLGADASSVRYAFQSEEEREERMRKVWGQVFPGAEVKEVGAPGIGDILRPAELRSVVEVPAFGRKDGSGYRFRVLGRHSSLVDGLAPKPTRMHDLVLPTPSVEVHDIEYRLPRGMKFAEMPDPKSIDSPVGRFSLRVDPTPGGARVRTELEIRTHRFKPDQYPEFREFLRQVDMGLEQTFRVEESR